MDTISKLRGHDENNTVNDFTNVSYHTLAEGSIVIDEDPISVEFEDLNKLGQISKPHERMLSTRAAFNFIMADKIVREAIIKKMEEGYSDWKAACKLMGYDGDEPVYEVRITSSTRLPPYACVFRFDTIGNDRREQPWNGCQYE